MTTYAPFTNIVRSSIITNNVVPSDVTSAIHPIRTQRSAVTILPPKLISDPMVARCSCENASCSMVAFAVAHVEKASGPSASKIGEKKFVIQ